MDLIIKNSFKNIILSILILFSSQNMAASVSDAVTASKNNNVIQAAKLWSKLADSGNAIAQFNLGHHYAEGKGVKKNKVLAEQWWKDATHSGLVVAYLTLNKRAISPANGQTLSFKIGPKIWLQKQEPKRYTIQLASSRNEKSIKNLQVGKACS